MEELLNSIVPLHLQNELADGTVITIGNFDGVHRGHQSILDDVTSSANARGLTSLALTFEPHPAELFTDKKAEEYRIATAGERIELLKNYGANRVLTIPFTHEFAELPPHAFVIDLLFERLHTAEIHIGYDFAYGKGRAGNTRTLRELCERHGVDVVVHEAVQISETPISSTRVRQHLRAGDIQQANHLLGHVYAITGAQIRGEQRGREIGVPTINQSASGRMLPRLGVYASFVQIRENGEWMESVTNIGERPTFHHSSTTPNIETHILERDIICEPGETVRLSLLEHLRDEKKFSGADELKEQISLDVKQAKNAHQSYLLDCTCSDLPTRILSYPVQVK